MIRRVIAIRTLIVTLLVLLLVPATMACADEPSPNVTDEEFAELIKAHDHSLNMLLGLISGLSDEQWTFKQNAKRWSVGECTEHIVRSERALFQNAVKAMKNPPDPDWYARTKGKADFIRRVIPNRNPGGVGGAHKSRDFSLPRGLDRIHCLGVAGAGPKIRPRTSLQRAEIIHLHDALAAFTHELKTPVEVQDLDAIAASCQHPAQHIGVAGQPVAGSAKFALKRRNGRYRRY